MEPIYEACSRLGLTIFLHPHYGLGESSSLLNGYGHVLPLALGFPFETTIAVSRLILSGCLDRHPALTCLLAHAGGTVPFLAGRLDSCLASDPAIAAGLQHSPSDYLRRNFVYDGVIYHRAGLEALLAFLGPGNEHKVVFGTDHPFFPPPSNAETSLWPSATKNVRIAWEAQGGASGEKALWEGIMWRNASRLLRIRI
jgi:aminocarboxymuconate-semialdehyde decarboxylase